MLFIDEIRIEHALGPVVTDNPQPRFSFSLTSDRRESSLRSAHILVGDWRMEVIDQCCTVYNGPALSPLTNYPVRVVATDDAGERAEAETSFQTGRLDLPWQASWISDPSFHVESPNSPAPMAFRRRFQTEKELAQLRFFTSCMGIFDLYWDGRRLNEDYFAPGFTNYESDLQYTVTTLRNIPAGTHELTVIVAAGWAVGRTTHVDLEYADGQQEVFGTDESWEVTEDTPWRFADFFDGEVYDARIVLDKASWHNAAAEKLRVKPKLSARCGLPVTAHEVLAPIAWLEAPSGELIADFGQNIAGVVSFRVKGKAGQEIVFRHAETLERGELYVQNLRSAKQELRYICREGGQTYSPRFTYMGFRYVGIRGVRKEDIELKAIAVYSDLEAVGSFRCSNDDLNQLQSNLSWSGRDNFVDIGTSGRAGRATSPCSRPQPASIMI